MNQKGQALVEAIASISFITILVFGLMSLILLVYTKMITHRILYESLICKQLLPKQINCESKARRELSSSLILTSIKNISISSGTSAASAIAKLTMPLKIELRVVESIQLPLIN